MKAYSNKPSSEGLILGIYTPRQAVKSGLIFLVLLGSIALILFHEWLGLPYPVAASLFIFFNAIVFWITSIIPHGVTALLILGFIPVLGLMEVPQTFALFGNRAVFFILGVFIMVAAAIQSGLARRGALLLVAGNNQSLLGLYGKIFFSTWLMSHLMPEHAVAAIFFPIVLELSRVVNPGKSSRISLLLFVGMAWGCIIGGIGTLLGGARAILALEFLYEFHQIELSFWDYAQVGIPASVLLGLTVGVLFPFMLRIPSIRKPVQLDVIRTMSRQLGGMSNNEKKLGIIFLLTLVTWIGFSGWIDLSVASLLGAGLIFITKSAEWKAVDEYVNWNVILMYGGAIALGGMLNVTGTGKFLIEMMPDAIFGNIWTIMIFFAIVTLILTEFMSNAAALTIILPIALNMNHLPGFDPVMILFNVTLFSGLAFVFPMSSPPNAIAFSSGTYGVYSVIKRGVWVSLLSLVILMIYFVVRFKVMEWALS